MVSLGRPVEVMMLIIPDSDIDAWLDSLWNDAKCPQCPGNPPKK